MNELLLRVLIPVFYTGMYRVQPDTVVQPCKQRVVVVRSESSGCTTNYVNFVKKPAAYFFFPNRALLLSRLPPLAYSPETGHRLLASLRLA
jgi:hypothetical protein